MSAGVTLTASFPGAAFSDAAFLLVSPASAGVETSNARTIEVDRRFIGGLLYGVRPKLGTIRYAARPSPRPLSRKREREISA